MKVPNIEVQFFESAETGVKKPTRGIELSVSPYRLYQLYSKASILFPDAALIKLDIEQIKDDWDFLSLSDTDIEMWMRETQYTELIAFLRFMNNPAVSGKVFSNMSKMAAEMIQKDLNSDKPCEIDPFIAKESVWQTLNRLQDQEIIFNWRGNISADTESGKYCIDFGCASIVLDRDQVVSFMKSQFPLLSTLFKTTAKI